MPVLVTDFCIALYIALYELRGYYAKRKKTERDEHCMISLICGLKMAPHSSTLAWKIHGQRTLVGCSPWGREESDTTERLHFHFSLSCIGKGNGKPLQCSCLENPRDRGAWWAAVYGVAQSRTRLKWLSSSSSNNNNHNKHRYREPIGDCQRQGLGPGLEMGENGQEIQTFNFKSWRWHIKHSIYS